MMQEWFDHHSGSSTSKVGYAPPYGYDLYTVNPHAFADVLVGIV
jgi:hypothetical protein